MSRTIATGQNLSLSGEENEIIKGTNGKLVLTKIQDRHLALLLREDRLVAVCVYNESSVGNLYLGKIKNISANMDACFVEIENKEMCFLPFKDATDPQVFNRAYTGKLKAGDELAVRIVREAQKTKLASVSANVTLSESERKKLSYSKPFTRIDEAKKYRTDFYSEQIKEQEYNEIVTDLPEVFEALKLSYPEHHRVLPTLSDSGRIKPLSGTLMETARLDGSSLLFRLYEDNFLSLNQLLGLSTKLEGALKPRVWLKSGGYLIIEPTEALTVIDVNSGKYEARKGDVDLAIKKVNLEACEEIACQLRLRNLSGIIIVDFINMESKEDKKELMNYLKQLVSSDILPVRIVDMTPLGLVEITRKKTFKTLREQFR